MVFEILGVNLLEIIKRYEYKGIPVPICREIGRQTLIGLHYLHKYCGIIHTDLKPENVMVCLSNEELQEIFESGQLKLKSKIDRRLKVIRKRIRMIRGEEVSDDEDMDDLKFSAAEEKPLMESIINKLNEEINEFDIKSNDKGDRKYTTDSAVIEHLINDEFNNINTEEDLQREFQRIASDRQMN